MRKLLLIIAIATITVVAKAQNKVTTAKSTPEWCITMRVLV